MICSICDEVSQVRTGTRIPTAFTNTLWDRKLDSGRQREFDLSPQGCAAASQADGNSGGEHLPRGLLTTVFGDLRAVVRKSTTLRPERKFLDPSICDRRITTMGTGVRVC